MCGYTMWRLGDQCKPYYTIQYICTKITIDIHNLAIPLYALLLSAPDLIAMSVGGIKGTYTMHCIHINAQCLHESLNLS